MEKKFLKMIEEVLETEEPLSLDSALEDLECWDSLAELSLTSIVDDEFGIVIGYKDLKKMRTIRDIFNFIIKNTKENS